jgi:hAT family C-terminal dimerisation region
VSTWPHTPEQVEDKWGLYAESGPEPITDTTNLYIHWSAQSYLGGVQQTAYDHLSIPATSAERERVFTDTKLTISPNRNRLKGGTIEAAECLV